MKNIYLSAIAVLCFGFAGCTHKYVWSEYKINPDRITAQAGFAQGQKVSVLNGKSHGAVRVLGNIGMHKYTGTEQQLADAIADQLSQELRERQIEVVASAGKSLEITVDRTSFEQGMWMIAGSLDFEIKFGNGTVKNYFVRNSTPTNVPRAFNGAVALAVIEILNDPEVISYIKE